MSESDRYAVMGNPVAHSKSPQIHRLFAEQTGQRLSYEALLVDVGGFAKAARAFMSEGGRGLNITVPFKREAWVLADLLSARAEAAGAVNTLMRRGDGALYGDNTDGPGLVRDLTVNHDVALEGRRLLVLGAGGAVRGVLKPLLEGQPARLTIANRSRDKAEELALHFARAGVVRGCGLSNLGDETYDVIVNGTAAGLTGELPVLPDDILADGGVTYDMMYADEPTAFVRWGREHGARLALDGLGMLVEQAAESFLLWRGVRPDTSSVLRALRG